jgi:hypothetical protein
VANGTLPATINILKDKEAEVLSGTISASVFAPAGNPYTISVGSSNKSDGIVLFRDNSLSFTTVLPDKTSRTFTAEVLDKFGSSIKFTSGSIIQSEGTPISVTEFTITTLPFVDNPLVIQTDDPIPDTPIVKEEPTVDDTPTPPVNEEVVLPPSYLLLDDDIKVDLVADHINALSSSDSDTITLNGSQTINKTSIKGVVFGHAFNPVTTIPNNFLNGFTSLTSLDLSGFSSVKIIGDNFLANCSSFNQSITIPSTVTQVGAGFLFECVNMQSFVNIYCSAYVFTESANSFATTISTAKSYTEGIKLNGINETITSIRTIFPDSTDSPYRKFLDLIFPPVPEKADGAKSMSGDDRTYFQSSTFLQVWIDPERDENDKLKVPGHWAVSEIKKLDLTRGEVDKFSTKMDYIEFFKYPEGKLVTYKVYKSTITKLVLGPSECSGIRSLSANFLYEFVNLTTLDLSGISNVNYIGNNFMYGCKNFTKSITIPVKTNMIGDSFMANCTSFNQPINIPNNVTYIGSKFLSGATKFNSLITFPTVQPASPSQDGIGASNGLTEIGDSFLGHSTTANIFNQDIVLPATLRRLGSKFMENSKSFNKPFTVPASVTIIGQDFFKDCTNMTEVITIECNSSAFNSESSSLSFATTTNNVPAISQGIKIAGSAADDILANFPNSSVAPRYRNLSKVSN